MKKYILCMVLAVALLFSTAVFAVADHAHVYDEPDLISSENENKCERISQKIEEEFGLCVVFCFPSALDGFVNINAYCADVYVNRVAAENALVLARDQQAGTFGCYLAGDAGIVFTESRMNALYALYNEAATCFDGVEAVLNAVAAALAEAGVSEDAAQTDTAVIPADDIESIAATAFDKDYVADYAGLLTEEQEYDLAERLAALSQQYEADFVVLTERTIFGRLASDYADDYFDYNGYGRGDERSGILLLYVPGPVGEREVAISTRGSLLSCVSDADSDAILDAVIPYLIDEDYASAFELFASMAAEEAEEIGKAKVLPLMYIPLCLLIGFVIAFIVLKIQTASLKSVRQERTARYYVQPGSLVLTGSFDRFLYKNVSKTPKQTQNSSSGSGGRVSSSGARHGGTSRKF